MPGQQPYGREPAPPPRRDYGESVRFDHDYPTLFVRRESDGSYSLYHQGRCLYTDLPTREAARRLGVWASANLLDRGVVNGIATFMLGENGFAEV